MIRIFRPVVSASVLALLLFNSVPGALAQSSTVEEGGGLDSQDSSSVSDWPEEADGDLPLAGILYGNPYAGVGTANATIAVESSRRFRAERSGYLGYVKYHNRILRDYEIDGRCAQSGNNPEDKYCVCKAKRLDAYTCGYTMNTYHVGNGGTIVVEVRPDDGNGLPGSEVLGKTESFIPMNNQDKWYPELRFETQPYIEEGRIYHLVFTNLTPPVGCDLSNVSPDRAGGCPRDQGAMSLNGNFHLSSPSATGKYGPYRGDSSATLIRRTESRRWEQYWNTMAYYELRYTDGVSVGDTYYGHYATQSDSRVQIGGAVRARQRFTVSDDDRNVNGVWLNYGHERGADGSSLRVELKDRSGSVLASGSIAASEGCIALADQGRNYTEKNCREWGYVDFGRPVVLSEDYMYFLELSGGTMGRFVLSTYLPFTSHGFKDRNHWFGARAEYTEDSGRNWNVFDGQWYGERDFAMAFTIEGMPRQMP